MQPRRRRRPGWPAAPTSSPAGSACSSRPGTAHSLREQEQIIGRDKGEGAPLSGGTEFSEPDFAATGRTASRCTVDSHVRLAHPSQNNGAQLLRRGYNFADGTDGLGRLDAGLFFLAYQRDPRTAVRPGAAAGWPRTTR